MQMKVYLHLQDLDGNYTTKIAKSGVDGENSLQTLAECACSTFPQLQRQPYTAHILVNDGQQKKPIPLTSKVWAKLKHSDDVFLEAVRSPADSSKDKPSGTACPPLLAVALQPMLANAASAVAAKNLQLAAELLEQALSISPGHVGVLAALGGMWLQHAQQPQRALPYLEHLAREQPTGTAASSKAHEMLGDCLLGMGSGSAPQALQAYNQALNAAMKSGATLNRQHDLQIAMARAMRAHEDQPMLKDVASKLVMNVLGADQSHFGGLELYAVIAEEQGMYEDALRVALRLVIMQRQHPGVRALLARRLQAPGGVQALYTELSLESGASVNSAASRGIHEAPTQAGQASALAFLASVVKDHGACTAVVVLLHKALELDPLHAGYALSLAHALELTQDLAGVVACVAAFLRRVEVAGPRAEALALGGGVRWKDVADLLEGLPAMDACDPASWWAWRAAEPWQPQAHASALMIQATSPPASKVEYSPGQLDMLALCFTAVKILYVGGAVARAARLVALLEPARLASTRELHTTLIRNEAAYYSCVLQLLRDAPPPPYGPSTLPGPCSRVPGHNASSSCAATTAHVAEQGNGTSGSPLEAALQQLEISPGAGPDSAAGLEGLELVADSEARQGVPTCGGGNSSGSSDSSSSGSRKGCTAIGGLHCQAGSSAGALPVQGPNAPQPLFLCGDSHCLSAAWRLVMLKGQPRLLHPLLVTGCKVWHLRPASTFYPKVQFQNVLAHVPDGAQVVMLLGEIDCREGLLMSVQKCKYPSLEAAISAAVDLYLLVLVDLVKRRSFELYIHPIPPVLNETRTVVKAFAKQLKNRVPAAASSLQEGQHRLRYLDFFDRLLSPDGCVLAPGLALDGTHLSPAYLTHMIDALKQA